jgi:hypothetical protein
MSLSLLLPIFSPFFFRFQGETPSLARMARTKLTSPQSGGGPPNMCTVTHGRREVNQPHNMSEKRTAEDDCGSPPSKCPRTALAATSSPTTNAGALGGALGLAALGTAGQYFDRQIVKNGPAVSSSSGGASPQTSNIMSFHRAFMSADDEHAKATLAAKTFEKITTTKELCRVYYQLYYPYPIADKTSWSLEEYPWHEITSATQKIQIMTGSGVNISISDSTDNIYTICPYGKEPSIHDHHGCGASLLPAGSSMN